MVSQHYAVNVMDEYVLRGNPGILKCHIPSFVADFVYVEAWIENENVQLTLENSRDYGIHVELQFSCAHLGKNRVDVILCYPFSTNPVHSLLV